MAAIGQYDRGAAPGARSDFSLMPEGDYFAQITESEVAQNSKGTGLVLKLTREILAPDEFKGRKVWQRINIEHSTPKAQEIGQIELANVKAAVGVNGQLQDSVQLHNKPHGIRLKIEKGNGQFKDQNTVFDSFAASANGAAPAAAAAAPAPAPVAAPAPAPAAANAMPWARRA